MHMVSKLKKKKDTRLKVQIPRIIHYTTYWNQELSQNQMQTDQAAAQTQEVGCCLTLPQKQVVVRAGNQQKTMMLKTIWSQSLEGSAGWHPDFVQMLGSGQHQMLDWQMVLNVQCQIQRRILEAKKINQQLQGLQ